MPDANTRPDFYLPWPKGTRVVLKSYVGHNPDNMKMDMYADGWPNVHASAPGYVHEEFYPGGVEVRHYIPGTNTLGNWYTTYMHMERHVPVGTHLEQGDFLGVSDSVGTGVHHLHYEQLHDASGDGDADTNNMVFPAFVEINGGRPFPMPVRDPFPSGISQNSQHLHPQPHPHPHPSNGGSDQHGKIHQDAPVPNLIRRGSGQYLGLYGGPSNSHGGYYQSERPIIRMLQERLVACGFVPGITNVHGAWVDGKFGKPTAEAVERFQKKHMPNTQFFGRVYFDDWHKLFNL